MAAWTLCLLCVLQATLNISLRLILFNELTEGREKLEASNIKLQTRYDNLTEENGDLQASYIKLQTSYDNLTEEKGDLHASYIKLLATYANLTEEIGDLQAINRKLTEQGDQLKKGIGRLNERIRMCEEGRPCPQGWRKLGCSCYYVSTEKNIWGASRQDCLSRGADLVVINSREEQEFINGLYESGLFGWIGLSDRETEGNWTWVDGTPLTTGYWRSEQPDSRYGDEDCVQFYHLGSDQLGEWIDYGCSSTSNWICEK